jgi:ATP-dependent DNA helicase RecG
MSRFSGAAVLGLIFIKSQTVSPMSLIESERPFDLSKTLQHLTQVGLLESTGGRGAAYHLPGEPIPTPDDVFGPAIRFSMPSSLNLAVSSPNLAENRDPDGCLISEQLSLPLVDDLEPLSQALRSRLEGMAAEPRAKGKVHRQVLIAVVLQLCEGRFVTLRSLAELVHRKPDTLRDQYLKKLVGERQAYTSVSRVPE